LNNKREKWKRINLKSQERRKGNKRKPRRWMMSYRIGKQAVFRCRIREDDGSNLSGGGPRQSVKAEEETGSDPKKYYGRTMEGYGM